MKRLLFLCLLAVPLAHAQTHPWDGIIDPSRAVDWTHAGIPGGIPNVTTVCAAVTMPIQPSGDATGATDTTAINTALSTCGATATATTPVVVTLAAGTFYSNGITFGNPAKNYTVLRGAGPDKTIIVGNNVIGCGPWGYICIYGSSGWFGGSYAGKTTWTGTDNVSNTYTQGATMLDVGSTAGMVTSPIGASGNIIGIDQRSDAIGVCPPLVIGGIGGPGCTGVNGATESGNTVTIHTGMPHGFSQGDCVGVGELTQSWTITNAVFTAATQNTVTLTITPNPVGTGNLPVGAVSPPVVWGGTSQIIVQGVTPTAYNGTFQISAVTASTITLNYPNYLGTPAAYNSGGTASSQFAGYSSDANQSISCGGKAGYFSVATVPTQYSFTYTAANANLANGGGIQITTSWTGQVAKDTGGVIWNAVQGPFSNEGGNSGRNCPDTLNNPPTCIAGEISRRDPREFKRVVDICTAALTWQNLGTACAANTIMVDPPVELSMWRSGQVPGIFWLGNYAVGDGVEGLTLDMSAGIYDSARGGIVLNNAYRSWVRNVRTINGDRDHIWIQNSAQLIIRDNYFFGVKGTGTQSYGIEDWSSDSLHENNICQHIIACEMVAASYGGVFAYNYAIDCPWGATSMSLMNCTSLNHDFSAMVLQEGDNTPFGLTDNIHGMSYAITSFRTRYRAQDTPWKYNSLEAHSSAAYTRGNNLVDNVLGTRRAELQYYDKRDTFDGKGIYNNGYQAENFQVPIDLLVRPLLLRWGNYDVCADSSDTGTPQVGNDPNGLPCTPAAGGNGIRFCGNSSSTGFATTCGGVSEIPTAGAPSAWINPNPVPTKGDTTAGQAAFPASFFLSGQPDFWATAWGTPGWPAIGADVTASGALDTTCANPPVMGFSSTSCDGVGHHSYQIPAQICWNNTAIDPAGTGVGGSPQQAYPITSPITSANVGGWIQYTVPLPAGHPIPQCSSAPNSGGLCMSTFTITGASPSAYNGTWMASMVTATGISFVRPLSTLALPAYQSGGTVNWPNVRLFNAATCYPVAYGGEVPPTPTTPPSIINGQGTITGQGKIS